MKAQSGFRGISVLLVALLLLGQMPAAAATPVADAIGLEPGGGRILSLTGEGDPLATTGMATGMSQQPGARFEPAQDNCLLQPPEMDLRLLWIRPVEGAYAVTLRFFAPFHFLEELYGQPVKHTLTLIFTPPEGEAVTVAVGKSERLAVKRGKEALENEGATITIYSTDVVFTLPDSIGIGPDSVLTTRSRIVAEADYCPDPNFPNRYFEVNTTPVLVSALTGEEEAGSVRALPRAMAYQTVSHKEYKAIEWHEASLPAGTQLQSLHLEEVDGDLIAVMTMDAPFAFPLNADGSPAVTSVSLGLDLVAPEFLGLNHPYSVRIDLFGANGAPPAVAYVSAVVPRSEGSTRVLGSVPVRYDGDEIRIVLGQMTPVETPVAPSQLQTGEGYVAEIGDSTFSLEGTLSFEQPDGAGGAQPFTLEVAGPALRFTFADGTVSTGWLDPYSNEFIVDGPVVAGGSGVEDKTDPCAEAKALAQGYDEQDQLLKDTAALEEKREQLRNDPGRTLEDIKALVDEGLALGARLRALNKKYGPLPVKATGCDKSPPKQSVVTTLRAAVEAEIAPAEPDWLAALPGLYWDLSPIGLQPISFGERAPAAFPFQSPADWIPAGWDLTSSAAGWGIRGWSQVSVPAADGTGAIAPTVMTPYVAAALLIGSVETSEATPIASGLPGQAVLAGSPRRVFRVRRRCRRSWRLGCSARGDRQGVLIE